ncbi:T-complex protein 11-domain-containing protein [Cunninghamella echinulata]|nr:T-complex protein 11-domain-containing protein [Cunninghamella echinulata]
MDPSQFPLSKIKKSLNIIEVWMNNHIEQPTALDKLAIEELFNAYYSTEEVYNELSTLHSSSPPPTATTTATELTELLITNLSTLYLEAYRLQYIFKRQYESTITLDIKNEIEFILKEIKEKIQQYGTTKHMTQLEEAIERIPDVIPTLSTNNNNHSIPSSPTPRFEKLSMNQQQSLSSNTSTVISSEQLNRLLTGYASSSTGMTNEQLAHELIMNPDFQLQSPKKSSSSSLSSSSAPTSNMTIEERIDTIARQAFFDQVSQDIQQGHMEKSVLPLIEDIKQRLLSFVSPTTSLAETIHDTLDISFLDQQIKQHAFNLDNTLQFILNTMLQMAAPIRDSSIQQIIDMKNNNNNNNNNDNSNKKIYGQLFRLILETLDLMSLDLMNYRLKSLRPHLIPMATEYEHNKFSQALSHSTVGLAKTRQWIQHSLQQLNNKQQHKEKIAMDKVLNQGYIDLFTAKTALTRLTCPETMLLDIDRLVNYQNEVQKLTIIAALVLIGRNMKMKDIKTFTKRLFFILQNDGVDGRLTLDHLYVEMEKALPEQSKATRQQKDWIRSMVSKTLSHSDPVYHLLVKRIISILSHQLTTGQFVEDSVLVSSGLDAVQRQLKTLCTKILIFTQYNRKVYASWYQDLIVTLQEI